MLYKSNQLYKSTTNIDHNLNSDLSPLTLHLLPNTLLARPISTKTDKLPRIQNPIPQDNIDEFKTTFFEENAIHINDLTTILLDNQATKK